MPSVWIIMEGENCEGGSITGVYATREAAEAACAVVRAISDAVPYKAGTDWIWHKDERDDELSWSSGCDWMTIAEWEVLP